MIWNTHLTTLFALATSLPLSLAVELDAWVPQIRYPYTGVQWRRGDFHHCKWEVADRPPSVTNPVGKIYLVQNYHLVGYPDNPLASDFNLADGEAGFVVPTDIPAGKYRLDLMGDSGNWSDEIDIV